VVLKACALENLAMSQSLPEAAGEIKIRIDPILLTGSASRFARVQREVSDWVEQFSPPEPSHRCLQQPCCSWRAWLMAAPMTPRK
jgi:hypothetical protein